MRQLAVKRLTASDLTFFRWHFENRPAGNQKAINLNKNVFIDLLFPSLPVLAKSQNGRFPLDLTIYGPGLAGPLNLQRKIVKLGAYKNWRLNGEFISDPPENPDRFHQLGEGDFLILDFLGEVQPVSANALLVSRTDSEDAGLHEQIARLVGSQSMLPMSLQDLEESVAASNVADGHPVFNLVLEDALEDASQNGAEGISRLSGCRSSRALSRPELDRARQRASQVGDLGEELVNYELLRSVEDGMLDGAVWVSAENAISPYDFEVTESGENVLVEVKTTSGDFDRMIHISMSELRRMAEGSERCDIYRVYEASESGAKMRVARDVRDFAARIAATFDSLPDGTAVDSISVRPSVIAFEGTEVILRVPKDDGE